MMPALTDAEIGSQRETVESTMIHRAVVTLASQTGTDPYGHPTNGAPATTHAALECLLWTLTGREAFGPNLQIVAGDRAMIVPVDTTITERHTVASVQNSLEETIAGPLNIRKVMTRPTHKILLFDEVA